jgi:hypothetical protein
MPVEDCVPLLRYNVYIVHMISSSPSQQSIELNDVCVQLQKMGYAEFKRIRIYGQEFEAVSNPFPNADGFAIRAFSTQDTQERTVQLPLPVVQMVKRQKRKKVA